MGLRHTFAAGGLAAVLALAACAESPTEDPGPAADGSAGSAQPGADQDPDGPADPAGPADAADTSTDPFAEYAVDRPGPLRERLLSADILISTEQTIPRETVQRIRRLPGVTAVEPLSVALVSVEDRVLSVAAVDAAGYRRFTGLATAEEQAVWDRVAGGEIAVRPALQARLPLDEQDFVRLGSEDGSPSAHVGAWAPQVPTIDAVVNERWAEELGMEPGNALVVSTTITAPQAIRGPVKRILGANASVQLLDIATRLGLDPDAVQTAVVVGTVADAVGTFSYRTLGGGRIAPDPAWVASHIGTEAVPILGTMTCNRAIFPQLRAALEEVVASGLADEIHPEEYAGCYYPRFIAGTTTLSNHSFGLAFDINVPGNQRGTAGELHRGVVAIFKKWGFAWGGDWRWTDPMHFELARIVEPD
ncbi:M15 family metallopeptidase [Nocardioides sp. zg-DK7169]|uniref:M15 family metallopeptidase n=1 Tax=Nocardioides sp. zg-DK7169 TaxID=2736600 RepID=UPI001555CC57|nr:M15 family metallopeptidase [Nocardioides sp. zg-DK7169]NPC98083.1 M15 family metallopeptidase [Nocardioides sp. zg-DK7169]